MLNSSRFTGLEGQKLPLTGRIATISTQPGVSSACVRTVPHTPHPNTHTRTPYSPFPSPSRFLIRITQFMGISVWCAEEEIARQWLALGVVTLITLRGRDYKFMCVWVLHVYRRRCRMSLSRHAGNFHRSGQCHAVSLSSVCFVFFFLQRDASGLEAKHRRRQRRKGGGGGSGAQYRCYQRTM